MVSYLRIKLKSLTRNVSFAFLGRQKIKAVREEDLEDLLGSLGVREEFLKGNTNCFVCKKPVTIVNLQGVIKINGNIELICTEISCISKMQ